MSRATFRLVLLVSCAHALVHVFELSLPSVEQMIGDEFHVGRDQTGMLGTAWRLPFGLGALLAGWLADRFGSKRMLLVYLVGCSGMALLAYRAPSLAALFAAMFGMGCFASVYHPAGLALISTETTAENRPAALGWHGVLGSIGIAAAPLLAAVVFHTGAVTWRQYYALIVIPAIVIAGLLLFSLKRTPTRAERTTDVTRKPAAGGEARWGAFLLLVVIGMSMGFTYAAFMHFLPRYLNRAGMKPPDVSAEAFRNYLTAFVLLFAAIGQGVAGKIARPGRLEPLFASILFASAPPLVWMSLADGQARLWAACTLALVHFMNQPVYNSLIAEYVPRARRSLGYGFSYTLCFGIGGLGPTYAGLMKDDRWTYGGLAVFAAIGGLLALALVRWRKLAPAR